MAESESPPLLCVDLDGTLVATDTLDECLLCLARQRPWVLAQLPFWLVRGKAYFKHRVAQAAVDLLGPLPYRQTVIEYINEHRNGSGRVLLATAANRQIADRVSQELAIFSDVLASDETTNLSGQRKLEEIQQYAAGGPFAYIGDHQKDVPIWAASRQAIVVGDASRMRAQIGTSAEIVEIPTGRQANLRDWIRQLRCHQWAKNLLLFVPLILAHKVTDLPSVLACVLAMITFSFAASAVYIGNDLIDLPFDRLHPRKRNRPLASGVISIRAAVAAIGVLLVASLGLSAAFLPSDYVLMLLGYMGLNVAYTIWLKRVAVLDVILLAGFYVYRVLVGAVAIQVEISFWLLAFSMFFFLGLGMIKRFADLVLAEKSEHKTVAGRSYIAGDIEFFRSVGTASSCVAILVLAFYMQSPEVSNLYKHPKLLWLVCPLVLYWNMRAWLVAQRGEMPDDPILFALRDPVSYVVGAAAAALLLLATLPF